MWCVGCTRRVCPLFQESLLQSLKRVSCLLTRGQELAAGACTPESHHYLTFSMAEQRFYCSSKVEEEGEGEEEENEAAACSSKEEEEEEKEVGNEGSRSLSKPPR